MKNNLDMKKKLIKYLLFAFIIGLSVRYLPSNSIDDKEILMIAFIASITFAIIDMIEPTIKLNI